MLIRGLVVGVVLVATGSVAAQQGQSADALNIEMQIRQQRFQFQLMESVLENAVRQGAAEVVARAQGVMPTGLLFTGKPKAKGFPLDGYGIVFNIEIPLILPSTILISQLRPPRELPPGGGRGNASNGRTGANSGAVIEDPMRRSPATGDELLQDPDRFYTQVVRDRLIDAMLDYTRQLRLGPEESLSVVARGAENPMPNNIYDDAATMILRIRGADLALFHADKITRAEARKRVVESQF